MVLLGHPKSRIRATIPHPIRLHSHDFYVLGAGTGVYNDPTALNYKNPPRRDVATLPARGYLVIAFIADNPGAWLMYCRIVSYPGTIAVVGESCR